MTRQLPWQGLPALSARMADGLTTFQSAGALLVLENIQVILQLQFQLQLFSYYVLQIPFLRVYNSLCLAVLGALGVLGS